MSIMLQTNLIRTDKELAANRPPPPPPAPTHPPEAGSHIAVRRTSTTQEILSIREKIPRNPYPICKLVSGKKCRFSPSRTVSPPRRPPPAPPLRNSEFPASSGRSEAGDPKSARESSKVGEPPSSASSCTCAEVSSVLPWRRAYPPA